MECRAVRSRYGTRGKFNRNDAISVQTGCSEERALYRYTSGAGGPPFPFQSFASMKTQPSGAASLVPLAVHRRRWVPHPSVWEGWGLFDLPNAGLVKHPALWTAKGGAPPGLNWTPHMTGEACALFALKNVRGSDARATRTPASPTSASTTRNPPASNPRIARCPQLSSLSFQPECNRRCDTQPG
jgi:hypothetical protein